MRLLKQHCHSLALLLVALVVLQQVAQSLAFRIPRIPDWPADKDKQRQGEATQQQPPDKCPKNLCKGRICEVICKNNPSEGGKLCNCDTYALSGSGPSYMDCNRLI